MSAEPLDLAHVKRNGYPCDSRTFWSLVTTVEALTAERDNEQSLREMESDRAGRLLAERDALRDRLMSVPCVVDEHEALTARLAAARAAYLAGDWDSLEAQLNIRDLSVGATSTPVDDLRRAATADPTPQTETP
jgi:hypothetical protein